LVGNLGVNIAGCRGQYFCERLTRHEMCVNAVFGSNSNLKSKSFQPLRTLYLSSVPEEETGGHMGQESSLPPQSSKKSM